MKKSQEKHVIALANAGTPPSAIAKALGLNVEEVRAVLAAQKKATPEPAPQVAQPVKISKPLKTCMPVPRTSGGRVGIL